MVLAHLLPWLTCVVVLMSGCDRNTEEVFYTSDHELTEARAPKLIPMPMRPRTEDLYPCGQCHATSAEQAAEEGLLEPNLERREMTDPHEVVTFTHDAEHRWCLDCHDVWDRDSLRLASGERIRLQDESVRLCAQCHGPQHRDWKVGVHGRRLGEWHTGGQKKNYRCVNCHDPHSPQIKPIKPQPAPLPPGGRHGHEQE